MHEFGKHGAGLHLKNRCRRSASMNFAAAAVIMPCDAERTLNECCRRDRLNHLDRARRDCSGCNS
jgi:hypothetical protein